MSSGGSGGRSRATRAGRRGVEGASPAAEGAEPAPEEEAAGSVDLVLAGGEVLEGLEAAGVSRAEIDRVVAFGALVKEQQEELRRQQAAAAESAAGGSAAGVSRGPGAGAEASQADDSSDEYEEVSQQVGARGAAAPGV